jgi:hypothetical protein
VAKIANSPFGRKLYASQSHETLLISPLESWPERNLAPCIIIKPRKNSVRIVKCSKGKITELTPSLGDAWGILEPLLHWLESSVFQILPESKPR